MRPLSFLLAAVSLLAASTVPRKDFAQFENLGTAVLSPDGTWVAYVVNKSDRSSELRTAKLSGGETRKIAFGTQAAFSSDSKWLAYAIGVSEAEEEKLKKDKKPVRRKLGLMDLAKGEQSTIEGVESFAFSPNGAYLAIRRYPPEKTPPPATPDPDAPPAGATLLVKDLAKGVDSTFGNVSEYAWQDVPRTGHLLAIAISAEDKTGNGLNVFDPATGNLRVLDSSPSVYSGIAWRKKSADLAVLRSKTDDVHDGSAQTLMAWTGLGGSEKAFRLDPSLPDDTRVVAYRKPSWALQGGIVFIGMSKWEKKPPKKDDKQSDDLPAVDIWHWRDPIVMAKQKIDGNRDKQRNLLAAWLIESNRLRPLATVETEQVSPLNHQPAAYATTWTKYAMERSIGRPAADLSLVDLTTGERKSVRENLRDDYLLQPSPGGRYLLFVQDDQYWTVNTSTGAVTNITRDVPTSFVDRESDFTVRQKPPFGVAGWTQDDGAVWLYDKFDVWQVSPGGGAAKKLTDGAQDELRHRYVKLDPDAEFIDDTRPLYFSLFGIWSKKSGYSRFVNGKEEHIALEDRMVSRLTKARDAEVYVYSKESFEESPNYFLDGRKISDLNPFLSQYAWSKSEIVEYKNSKGRRLQGALFYPAGYEAGKRYPMIVYMYERLSDNVHRFSPPSERDYYNPGVFTQSGYFVLMPDIVFRAREPGMSVKDCVESAVKASMAKASVDAKRIGVVGHSWGGFDASFLATHSSMFAAAVAGAPITDLVSNYGNHHWTSGIAETDHIETGQQRMEVPLYEDLPAYIRNSAVFQAHSMTVPLLIEVGDADGTVFYHQGVELYNVARRAGKNVVLLVYNGEDHGLRKKANQIDYQRRILAWFDHYLNGAAAEPWVNEGETYLQRQQALKLAAK